MEHSKLPIGLVPVDNIRKSGRPESLEIWDSSGQCIASFHEEDESFTGVSIEDMERAAFIVKACNAHAKLEEKAELLKEAIVAMMHAKVFIVSRQHMHRVGIEQFDEIISKAKDLSL